jgi:hypothetical protein
MDGELEKFIKTAFDDKKFLFNVAGFIFLAVYIVFQLIAMGVITNKISNGGMDVSIAEETFVRGYAYAFWVVLILTIITTINKYLNK